MRTFKTVVLEETERENTRVINSSDVINDLSPDTGNLDIERIQNNCRVHVYNTH